MNTYGSQNTGAIMCVVARVAPMLVLVITGNVGAATWTQKTDMPTARWSLSSAAVNGKIYVIGGLTSETSYLNGRPIVAVEQYDPATDTWTRKSDMPAARGYLDGSLPVVDGKIYVIGGGNPALGRVDVYEPDTDTWSRAADMPTPRLVLAQVAFDGKIYALGGLAGLGNSDFGLKTVEVYDPQTDTWTDCAPMPSGVWGHSAQVVNGRIHVLGGAYSINAMQIHQVYDPQTDTWSHAASLPILSRGFGAVVRLGKIYIVGGWLNSGATPYTDTWVFNPTLDTWTPAAPLPSRRAALAMCAVTGSIYAIGGTPVPHNTQATPTVYELNPGFDFTGDDIVDAQDISVLVDHWHTDSPDFDITEDGIVDVQDLIVLSESLFTDYRLLAHWMLDETEGVVAYDSAAENDGIVLGNPIWQPESGQVNGALAFDGIDDVIIVDPVLNPAEDPFSVFTWIKGGTTGQVIISQQGGVNWLETDINGAIMTELTKSGGRRAGVPLRSETVITDDNWHRVGFAWDGTSRILYVDDVEVARDTLAALDSADGGLRIGAGSNLEAESFWSGMIDEVRIFNRAIVP